MNYSIEGEPLPVVICNLEPNETMITEKGAMSWMTPNMKMETTSNGGIGKDVWTCLFRRKYVPESLHCHRRSGHDCICIQFSRLHPSFPDWARTGNHCAKNRISRIYCRCNPFHLLPEAVRRRTLRWRRLHHAAAFRKRHCIPGI